MRNRNRSVYTRKLRTIIPFKYPDGAPIPSGRLKKVLCVFTIRLLITFLVFQAVPVLARTVTLWHEGTAAVSSMLPDDWRKMTQEELTKIYQDNRAIISAQSGTLVSGFFADSDKNLKDRTYILVLAKIGERVPSEMIQKTYVWLQKNNELVKSMLPDQVKVMRIENIEYRQDLPSIFFQNRLDMGGTIFVGVSAIFFLNNSHLNVVCIANEQKFADYKGIFQSFINRVSIPPSLHYASGPATSPAALTISSIREWFLANEKPILGAAMLIGIYVFVFRLGRRKRLKD